MEDQIFVSAKFRRRLLDFPPIPMNKPCSFVIQYASSSQLLWLQRKTDANWNGCEKTGCSQSISLLNTAATADEYQLFITFSTQLVLISFLIFLIFQLFDCFLSSVVLAVASSLGNPMPKPLKVINCWASDAFEWKIGSTRTQSTEKKAPRRYFMKFGCHRNPRMGKSTGNTEKWFWKPKEFTVISYNEFCRSQWWENDATSSTDLHRYSVGYGV